MSRARQIIEKVQKLRESPTNLYVVDDENLSKIQLKRQMIKLEKEGKEIVKSSVFSKNLKYVEDFHKLVLADQKLKEKVLLDDLDIGGEVYLISKDVFKTLGNINYLYVTKGDEKVYGYFKFEDYEKLKLGSKNIICSKTLIWKEVSSNFSLNRAIDKYYFGSNYLNRTYLLSDEFYTEQGKKSLESLLPSMINKGNKVYLVEEDKIIYQFKSSEELKYEIDKYFGDSLNYSKYRFLIEKI